MVRLSWNDIAQETSYSLTRNGFSLVSLLKDTTSYDDKGLSPDTTYHYELLACSDTTTIASATVVMGQLLGEKHNFLSLAKHAKTAKKNYKSS